MDNLEGAARNTPLEFSLFFQQSLEFQDESYMIHNYFSSFTHIIVLSAYK